MGALDRSPGQEALTTSRLQDQTPERCADAIVSQHQRVKAKFSSKQPSPAVHRPRNPCRETLTQFVIEPTVELCGGMEPFPPAPRPTLVTDKHFRTQSRKGSRSDAVAVASSETRRRQDSCGGQKQGSSNPRQHTLSAVSNPNDAPRPAGPVAEFALSGAVGEGPLAVHRPELRDHGLLRDARVGSGPQPTNSSALSANCQIIRPPQ
ncbi:hypothetical protein NONI108955_36805 [Nocardia ninae]